ncbi:MAG TPA: aromatic acid exporter family protein [Bacillota bacterium]|nr:aromatic acid exporter family protein [Bacillota bacterium]
MKIGYRTLKTALGASLSILIAQSLGLQFYVSAGILTILSIQVTRKRSLISSLNRIISCLLGFSIGAVFFELLGYNWIAMGLLILVYLPILVRLKAQEGFVTGSVIVLHLYIAQEVGFALFLNEIQIIAIGIGIGLLMNLYMPNNDLRIRELQTKIEENFGRILMEYAIYLRVGESNWDGKEMIETPEMLSQAKGFTIQKLENDFLKQHDTDYYYFEMREKQFDLLERVLPIVSRLHQDVPQGRQLSEFVEELSKHIHPSNTAYVFLDQIALLRTEIKKTELPKTREEFETRASLFYLLNEFEQLLTIKQNYLDELTKKRKKD